MAGIRPLREVHTNVPRAVRRSLVVRFAPRDVRTEDGSVVSLSCGAPHPPYAIHLRSGQHIQIQSASDVMRLPYTQVRDVLRLPPEDLQEQDPAVISAFREWADAVEEAAPYTLTELAYDVDAETLCRILNIGIGGLASRQRGRTKWPVSDLYLLKLQFPRLDLEATCREIYMREKLTKDLGDA